MAPAFAMGMEDLQKRADAQAKAAEACKVKLDVGIISLRGITSPLMLMTRYP
jgi:hypothetical protein